MKDENYVFVTAGDDDDLYMATMDDQKFAMIAEDEDNARPQEMLMNSPRLRKTPCGVDDAYTTAGDILMSTWQQEISISLGSRKMMKMST